MFQYSFCLFFASKSLEHRSIIEYTEDDSIRMRRSIKINRPPPKTYPHTFMFRP